MTTAAVIPAHNEVRTIRPLVEAVREKVDLVIVVDDGSSDGTGAALADLDIRLIRHDSAGGKAAALATGFQAALSAGAQLVATLDGDGQHEPGELDRLLHAARQYPDHLVVGARIRQRHRQPGIRRFANRFADFWISWAGGQRLPDSQSGYRVYPRGLIEQVRPSTARRHGFVFETAMLIDGARAGYPAVAVEIDSIYRDNARASYFRPGRDVWEIFWFVFRRILLAGLYPRGLWRMLTRPARFA
ncbi:glycosyltransferase family 2 protein [Wenzhouxiangella sp. EGI_FJ10409]|uniref:glycosyltransferase family 2 protein n=1 Tax=Wenzhouxiangella sp. EGI_FJ10409 TaxID=3243767 RepID=UPI0035DEAE6D